MLSIIHEKLTVEGALSLDEISAPSNTTGYGKLYVKSTDSKLYFLDESGSEYDLTASGGGGIGGSGSAGYIPKFTGPTTLGNSAIYESGGQVGIGTASPSAKLHVDNGALLLTGSTGSTPISGAGTRMMWIPDKAAFRAGSVDGTQWDDVNIGNRSTAIGYNTMASGNYSTAMGRETTASGTYSTAMGWDTTAIGKASTAMGWDTTASGMYSTSMGYLTEANASLSTAMGYWTTASGVVSTAMGQSTTASGYASTAMGHWTTASGWASTTMGDHTTASGFASTAMGLSTTASGEASTAMGLSTTASGDYSTAIGREIEAVGTSTVAIALSDQNGLQVTQDNAMAIMGGNVGIGTVSPTSPLQVVGLPVYANNAAALAGGLTIGAFYRTGGDPDLVAVVH
jgi:hypothetical protein